MEDDAADMSTSHPFSVVYPEHGMTFATTRMTKLLLSRHWRFSDPSGRPGFLYIHCPIL